MSGEKIEQFTVDDWDQQEDEPEEQDVFEWTQYEPTNDTAKSGYDDDLF